MFYLTLHYDARKHKIKTVCGQNTEFRNASRYDTYSNHRTFAYFFLNFSTPVYKMSIILEPNMLEL